MYKTSLLGISIIFVIAVGVLPISFSESISIREQLSQGIDVNDLQCRNQDHVLTIRTSGVPACVTEKTAEKLNWNIIKTEFDTVSDTITKQTLESTSVIQDQDLMFAISSDVEFVGEAYGYYDPQVLRRPAPKEMSVNFGNDHYEIQDLVSPKSDSFSPASRSVSASTMSQSVTSSSAHENAIDYTQWLPTVIPDGFELKWIDINQPEVYGDDIGRLDLRYYVNTVDVSGDTMTNEIMDIAGFQITVNVHPYDDDPFPQKRIDFFTENGTSTQVLIEEKYGGIFVTIVESPSDPNVHGITLYGHEYEIGVGGRGISLETFEEIFLNIYERQ